MADTSIEFTEPFERALRFMEETRRHVFVTGRAGTGKSTLLQYFKANTARQVAVLAPTGVAALECGGADDPFLFPVQARRDTRIGSQAHPRRGRRDLPQARRHRHRRGLHGPGGPAGLRGCLPAPQRPRGRRPLRRPADDLHRRSLPASPRGERGREDALQDPLREPLFLQRPGLPGPGDGICGTGEDLPPTGWPLHRPAQRHPQPHDHRGGPRASQLSPRSGLRAPCRRVLHPPHQHQRPGRQLQRGAAQEAQGQNMDLDGNPGGRIRRDISRRRWR